MAYRAQVALPLVYRDLTLECGYRLDFIVEGSVVLEVKSVSKVHTIHRAQLITYLKLTGLRVGLLINFNVEVLHHGVHRIING